MICAVTIEEAVPRWMKEQGVTGGWLTAEYSMLPYSTQPRKARDIMKGRIDGRSVEIQRLIGRSLRAVVDLEKLGPRTIWVDCDVLQADGGTRTTAITGSSLALAIACRKFVREKKLDTPPMLKLVAAISAGVLDDQAIVDLNYDEDKLVAVDFNLVATEDSEFVEVQSSGEEATFTGSQLDEMLALGRNGISALIGAQRAVLARIMNKSTKNMQKITPFLWFDGQAEDAVKFYTSIFKDSKIGRVLRYDEEAAKTSQSGRPVGSLLTIEFEIEGQKFTALNGGPQFKFNESISFVVNCETQDEVDYFSGKLIADGGQESACDANSSWPGILKNRS